jgi:hypothetical protein
MQPDVWNRICIQSTQLLFSAELNTHKYRTAGFADTTATWLPCFASTQKLRKGLQVSDQRMRFPCLLVVISVILVALTQATVVVGSNQASLPGMSAVGRHDTKRSSKTQSYHLAAFRAGAKTPSGNKLSSSSRAHKDGGKCKLKKTSKRKKDVGPWSNRGKKSKASSFKTRLEKLAKQGQFVYKDVYRRAKVLRSSAFEAMLLKATWPSNDPVQPDILGEIIKYSIPAFKYSNAVSTMCRYLTLECISYRTVCSLTVRGCVG